ncbi:hypothetical protein J2Z31_005006 [Sinorhizobium kostiense]|uniref:DUF2946 domain-containing protein n=1 Tax=Sinorhizobium kostiense TaxID=76747 RepID=A0ABS4R820_9HYPH|nr:hypothetical protein [Sinorhizobium kostiense]
MLRRRNGWGLALVAACLLVLQTVLGAHALGGMPASPQLDAFGNPLCLSADHSDTGDHGGGSGHATDCCMLGCWASSQLAASSDASWVLPIPASPTAGPIRTPEAPVRAAGHYPGYPRAPPKLIS